MKTKDEMPDTHTWNYRVLARKHLGEEMEYEIVECHYGPDDNEVHLYAEKMHPAGGTLDDLRSDLQFMLKALELDILTENEIWAVILFLYEQQGFKPGPWMWTEEQMKAGGAHVHVMQ